MVDIFILFVFYYLLVDYKKQSNDLYYKQFLNIKFLNKLLLGTQKGKKSRTNDSIIKELCLIRWCFFFFSPHVKHSSIFNSCIRGSPRFRESKENISTCDDVERHCCPTSIFAGRSVCPRRPAGLTQIKLLF